MIYPAVAIGAQIDYAPLWAYLDELPHLLVGGTTGSGKSVFLRSVLWQLTSLYGPEELDLVLIDAKGLADYLDFVNAPHFKAATDFHLGVPGALELLERIVDEEIPRRTIVFRNYAAEALHSLTPNISLDYATSSNGPVSTMCHRQCALSS